MEGNKRGLFDRAFLGKEVREAKKILDAAELSAFDSQYSASWWHFDEDLVKANMAQRRLEELEAARVWRWMGVVAETVVCTGAMWAFVR